MFKVGDRVSVERDRGIVRYIGPVDGYNGEWVGIDWDKPGRGRHDGSVKGKRYFQASSPKSGSFVRPQSVGAAKDLLEEMNSRYNDFLQDSIVEFGSKTWSLVNMNKIYKKQKNLWLLRVVVVDDMNVARAPPKNCPPFKFCTELNLHNNLLSRWCDLLDILEFFPALRFLVASRNYMERGMKTVVDERKVSAPIDTLVLCQCRLDGDTANRITRIFPHVREIRLGQNDLKRFDPGEYGNNLEYIDLEENPINDFGSLHSLSTLPNLRNLNVADCDLHEIRLPVPVGFASLKSFNVKGNPLDSKQWMSEMAKLPALENLSCHSITENTATTISGIDLREIIIAKIPQLKVLEKSEISAVERRSAEIHFLNKFGVPPVADEHRADVERLIKLHGEPVNGSSVIDAGIGLLKLRLSYEGKVLERSLPETVTVQRLVGIASRLFHLDARKISLQICGGDGFVVVMDKPLRPLNFYSLSNEDIICVKII